MIKKIGFMVIALLLSTLFSCVEIIDTNPLALNLDTINLSSENRGVEIQLILDETKLTVDSTNILTYGVIYQPGDETDMKELIFNDDAIIIENQDLTMVISNIDSVDYNQQFYFRIYFKYLDDNSEEQIVYSNETLSFNLYEMALEGDSSYAEEILFIVDNDVISEVDFDMNVTEYTVSATSVTYEVLMTKVDEDIHITVSPNDGYRFTNQVTLLINDELVNASKYTIENQLLTYIFTDPNTTDLESYVDVAVTFNPDGGFWSRDIFENFTPQTVLSVTSLNDTTGLTLSLADSSVSTLRWFYKLFIKYNDLYDAYEIVYTDAAAAAISDLVLPSYDYVLAIHDNCSDVAAVDAISNYSNGLDEMLYIIFDSDISLYTSGSIQASFYSESNLSVLYEVSMNEAVSLPIPSKPEFEFVGWSDGERLFNSFPRYQVKDSTLQITYVAIWEAEVMSDVELYLANLMPDDVAEDLTLPTNYSDFSISWVSSEPEIISSTGTYSRPYQATTVNLTATIQSSGETLVKIFTIEVAGYKSLAAPIASSYIYRDYGLVTDAFFDTLDVINCAFIKADASGALSGSSVLSNINYYIMPKARERGNWVLFSIAPDSEWSTIASSSTRINTFADNIVDMINLYGFDGVDIDWETPTSTEATRFTTMMQVIYTKVKSNNPNHLVTAAIAGGMWQPPRYDLPNSHQYLDFINMMTYGMVSNNGYYQNALSKSTVYASAANSAGRTLTSCSIEESVVIYNSYGIPNSKIIAGVAFYGIRQNRTYDSATSTYSSWVNGGSVSFTSITNIYLNNSNYQNYYDSNAGVPYIISNDGTAFISYDNPRSIAAKSAYIIDNGLAGMMYWENGLDSTGTLLSAMEVGLK